MAFSFFPFKYYARELRLYGRKVLNTVYSFHIVEMAEYYAVLHTQTISPSSPCTHHKIDRNKCQIKMGQKYAQYWLYGGKKISGGRKGCLLKSQDREQMIKQWRENQFDANLWFNQCRNIFRSKGFPFFFLSFLFHSLFFLLLCLI